MHILISPAKKLDVTPHQLERSFTQPIFLQHSQILIDQLKQFSPDDVGTLMKLSPKLALLNHERFTQWQQPFKLDNAKEAIHMFRGDVYQGLDAATLNADDIIFAQQHLRILSGLYGLLRPLDLMQPYRLEMGTRLNNERGRNLYAFWGSLVADQLKLDNPDDYTINLASNEYYKVVSGQLSKVITPVFKDEKNGKLKIISFNAKKARGLMSRFIIQQRLSQPDGITGFKGMHYAYADSLSSANEWVFVR